MWNGSTSCELISIACFVATAIYIYRARKGKGKALLPTFLIGLFFAFAWEPEGTKLIWEYPGYSVYVFMDIPLAILVSWAWCMSLCHLFVDRITGMSRSRLIAAVSPFAAGILVGLVVETTSVFFHWWEYQVVGEKTVVYFPAIGVSYHLSAILGWGMLTLINLTFSTRFAGRLAVWIKGKMRLGPIGRLLLSSALLGLFNGWISWQLIINFFALVEGYEPRLYFTRYFTILMDWGVLATIMTIGGAIAISIYAWKKLHTAAFSTVTGDENVPEWLGDPERALLPT